MDDDSNGEEYGSAAILQEMQQHQAGQDASLLNLREVRAEDGPSLSLVSDMRRVEELQGIHTILGLHELVLLGVFRSSGHLGVG